MVVRSKRKLHDLLGSNIYTYIHIHIYNIYIYISLGCLACLGSVGRVSKRVEFEMPSVICHCVVYLCAECRTDKLFRQNPAFVEHAVISVTTSKIFKGA